MAVVLIDACPRAALSIIVREAITDLDIASHGPSEHLQPLARASDDLAKSSWRDRLRADCNGDGFDLFVAGIRQRSATFTPQKLPKFGLKRPALRLSV
jgi:hypothetical protein